MESNGFLNAEELPKICKDLQGAEIKMLLLIICYLSSTDKQYLANNEEWRSFMESMDYKLTPERTSTVLSALVKKGILKREVKGVFSIIGNLYVPHKKVTMEYANRIEEANR